MKLAHRSARRRAAALAGHQHDAAAAEAYLTDPDGAVRATALGALHRCDALTEAHLQAAVTDLDPAVRARAAELVAEVRGAGPAAAVALLDLLHDPDPTVVEVAAWASGERDPAEPGAVTRLAELATDADDALVREAAVAALGALGDPAGLPAVLAATTDKAAVRRRAVIALAAFEGDEVDAAFQRALTDRDWQVRQVAEDLTGPGGAPTSEAEDGPSAG